MKYSSLAITRPEDLIFGRAPHPVTSRNGIVVGGGAVYPELNFTLPMMPIDDSTLPEIREHYRGIVADALGRAVDLGLEAVVFECEIRLTPNDTRDFDRPTRMRSPPLLEGMLELFERGARAGRSSTTMPSCTATQRV